MHYSQNGDSSAAGTAEPDLLVIGGGIAGLGVARAASERGLRVTVVEARSICEQTSNNTLRIIHGGFRYLQKFDFPRMFQSLRDQTALLRDIPEAVRPLPCLVPLNRWGLKSRIPVMAATLLYGTAARMVGSPLPWPRTVSSKFVDENIPLMAGRAPYGAMLWHDATMIDPTSVHRFELRQLGARGAIVVENTRVSAVESDGDRFIVHAENGCSWRPRRVVNTTGPWMKSLRAPGCAVALSPAWCKGFNLVITRRLDPTYGIGVESVDGRLFFIVPRGEETAIGTWYVPITAVPEQPNVTREEIEMFLREFNRALPGVNIAADEVSRVDVGVLPMIRDSSKGPVLYGSERFARAGNYVEVMSTKYTTYRSQGRAVAALFS